MKSNASWIRVTFGTPFRETDTHACESIALLLVGGNNKVN